MTLHQNTSRIITLLICTLSGVTGILGQPPPANPLPPTWPQLAERGLVAGRTFDVSSIENISLENGAMNLNIPLASFPAGPGGSSSRPSP